MNKSIQMTHLCETASQAYYWTNGPTEDQLEEMSARPLADFVVSSLVTAGPKAKLLQRQLATINKACRNNDPETVVNLCAWILVKKQTFYMKVSMMEIILAYTRAYTLMHPEIQFALFFSFLYSTFFKQQIN